MSFYKILYRGSLSSCNYACDYCPFAKTTNTREELNRDQAEVERFVDWATQVKRPVGVFFTPWGEAIIHAHYRQALVSLSNLPQVKRVAIQTNLGCKLDELLKADRETLAIWATYHPTQTSLDRFVARCLWLAENGFRLSVGVVGLREHFSDLQRLRQALPEHIYLWVNCFKRDPNYYRDDEIDLIRKVDPYFDLNRHYYPSQGKACDAGLSSFTVDQHGEVRRCHFVDRVIANIYDQDVFAALESATCPNETCGCYIGYVHRPENRLQQLYGDNVLERIPRSWPDIDERFIEV